jgi:uncharacterized protein with HEPN domain
VPPREWRFRIRDILAAIEQIQLYASGLSFDDFQRDRRTVDAVHYNFMVIGEAARHVPEVIVSRHRELPSAEMRGMRNVVVHEYAEVDLRTVWDTVQHDLPPVAPELRRILEENP